MITTAVRHLPAIGRLPWRDDPPEFASSIAPGSLSASFALEMEGVRKSFLAGIPGCSAAARVLEAVDLRVRPGEVVGIAGGIGAGKTALLLCAAGLLRPDGGVVSWFGSPPGQGGSAPALAVYLAVRSGSPDVEVERALRGGARLVLLDHAQPHWLSNRTGSIERDLAARGSALVVAWRNHAALARVVPRTLVLRDGRLYGDVPAAPRCDAQRNLSAARARSALPSAVARSSIRSTCGRSFRSPQ